MNALWIPIRVVAYEALVYVPVLSAYILSVLGGAIKAYEMVFGVVAVETGPDYPAVFARGLPSQILPVAARTLGEIILLIDEICTMPFFHIVQFSKGVDIARRHFMVGVQLAGTGEKKGQHHQHSPDQTLHVKAFHFPPPQSWQRAHVGSRPSTSWHAMHASMNASASPLCEPPSRLFAKSVPKP